MKEATFLLRDVTATGRLARAFAQSIRERAVLALNGPLGVGKTKFVQELASSLDIDDLVSSPTFTMLNEYHSGRLPLFHLDLYRLSEGFGAGVVSMLDLELSEILENPHVVVIEWAELLEGSEQEGANFLAGLDYLQVDFAYDVGDEVLTDNQSSSLYKDIKYILEDDAQAAARRVRVHPFGLQSGAILQEVLTAVPELTDN
ncbi:MAG TPA: tRNA (adenosine(37)-N6)-threonylcarbamoyltransferase complex ATPase subunit type 1 TsaE [Oculatellaceae cyanobacterium]